MGPSQQDIKQFLAGKCTPEKADEIVDFLKRHPEALAELEGEDWRIDTPTEKLAKAATGRMWAGIEKETKPAPSWLWQKIAVAATVLLTIFGGSYLFMLRPNHRQAIVQTKPKELTIFNATKKDTTFALPDGSVVTLKPEGRISYATGFAGKTRDIKLMGNAIFEVAKNRQKPFTVFTSDMATTALGTRFSVSSSPTGKTTVKLFEGRVRVRTNWQNGVLAKVYLLLPGNELVYNRATKIARLKIFSQPHKRVGQQTVKTVNWFVFNNESLTETLDQLAAIYNVQIAFNRTELQGMSFIGQIKKEDNLEQVLRDIALLNNLLVERTKQGYSVAKK